ncbi:MAG: type II toxin-antitoxin system VapC family toxin [Nitrospinae bacterium]|nr:type II toxin-antitoxin system VapC family toxin [Nitrospinota bacterium]
MLDTSAYSEFIRGNEDAKKRIQEADGIFLSPVALGELLAGFVSGKNEKANRAILEQFLSSPRVRVLNIDGETSERYANIVRHLRESGTPIPTNDVWIASSAMQHGLKVLTSDAHFQKVPQIITLFLSAM